jgi:hypothetical protein
LIDDFKVFTEDVKSEGELGIRGVGFFVFGDERKKVSMSEIVAFLGEDETEEG